MINSIVDRHCHVGLTNRQAIKEVINHLECRWNTWKLLSRENKKTFMKLVIKRHEANQRTYSWVMGGLK